MWFVLMAYVLAYIDFANVELKKYYYLLTLAEVILLASLYVSSRLLNWAERQEILTEPMTQTQKRKFFAQSWLAVLGAFLVMWAVYYPGGFSPDSLGQYAQAAGRSSYNDWHPVLHTLFAFTLPLKLSGGWIGSIILFQIVTASLAVAYMLLTLAEFGNRKYAVLVLLYIVINPANLAIVMYPWKDVSFAVSAMIAMTCAVRAYFAGTGWKNTLLFVLSLSAATIFRHNAILFTLPMLIPALIHADRKHKFIVIAACCGIIFLVRGILYPYLEVQKPGRRIVETTCAPMTIITGAVYEAPDKVTQDIKDFVYGIVSSDALKENYRLGCFNSVKWVKNTRLDVIEEAGYAKILSMTLKCILQAPYASVRNFTMLTDMLYGIAGPADWGIEPGITSNDLGITQGGIQPLQRAFSLYSKGSRVLFKHVFWHTGVLLLAVLVLFLARPDFSRMWFVLPVFTYDFGTMLFLGGNDFRFFWVTYLVVPLMVLVLLRKEEAVS